MVSGSVQFYSVSCKYQLTKNLFILFDCGRIGILNMGIFVRTVLLSFFVQQLAAAITLEETGRHKKGYNNTT